MAGIPSVLMVGLPKIGKSTQSRLLEESFPCVAAVQSSAILRHFAQEHDGDERAKLIHAMFETSAYLDDRTLVSVITEYFSHEDRSSVQCALLDGVIRTIAQARAFESLFGLREVWHFDETYVDESELVSLMLRTGRAVENTREKALERIAIYKESTLPLLTHYRDSGIPIFSFDPRPSSQPQAGIDMVYEKLASRIPMLLK